MSTPDSPRFPVSLPVQWSESEEGMDAEIDRLQRQVHALLGERLVIPLVSAWPKDCEQVRFYWGSGPTMSMRMKCDVCYPVSISSQQPMPLMPTVQESSAYLGRLKEKQQVYRQEVIAPFEALLEAGVVKAEQKGLPVPLLCDVLGVKEERSADWSVWFSSAEDLLARLNAWVHEKIGPERREVLLDSRLPPSIRSTTGPRF